MNDNLTHEAAALIIEGRKALRPTNADKTRVLTALRGRVDNTSSPHDKAPTTGEAATPGLTLGKIAALTAGVLAAVSAFIAQTGDLPESTRTNPEAAPMVSTQLPIATASQSATASFAEPIDTNQRNVQVAAAARPPSQVARAEDADRLAEEVALLTRGERNFHSGDLRAALAAVNEHSRIFPKGTLAPERTSLRTQILCAMDEREGASPGDRRGRANQPSTDGCTARK